MKKLHEILTILLKYTQGDSDCRLHLEYTVLFIDGGPDPKDLSKEDLQRLDELHVEYIEKDMHWYIHEMY